VTVPGESEVFMATMMHGSGEWGKGFSSFGHGLKVGSRGPCALEHEPRVLFAKGPRGEMAVCWSEAPLFDYAYLACGEDTGGAALQYARCSDAGITGRNHGDGALLVAVLASIQRSVSALSVPGTQQPPERARLQEVVVWMDNMLWENWLANIFG